MLFTLTWWAGSGSVAMIRMKSIARPWTPYTRVSCGGRPSKGEARGVLDEEGSHMAIAEKTIPTWRDVKAELDRFDRAGLLGLIKDLHGASRDNEAFLYARLGLGSGPVEPTKKQSLAGSPQIS
jgi:hypothetical protein